MPFWPVKWSELLEQSPADAPPRRRNRRERAPGAAPATVYLLAENLDAVLASGEDLQQSALVWNAGSTGTPREIAAARQYQRRIFNEIRSLEMMVVARALKARERAEELGRRDVRFLPMAKLFTSGTALLLDVNADLAATADIDFRTGSAMTAYLRGRGVLAMDTPAPDDDAAVAVTDDFLIAERVPLGSLMDLAAMFLDTLETHYDLFEADDTENADALSVPFDA